jgi:ABC-type uncharacterized transport system ATPase subunit
VTAPALELHGIVKRFGPVQALRGADFTLVAGEVHALLGENGAGKSTLMHIAYGLVAPDAGTIAVRGRLVAPRSPRESRRLGIGMVHQHFTSIAALTVAENVALAAGWPVRPRELSRRLGRVMERTGLGLEPDARAGSLGVALKQRLEMLKALAGEPTILLLDEPTAVLAPREADAMLATVREFARTGGAAVLITHKLDEALRAADRVTVLRAGRVTLTGQAANQTPQTLAGAMIGAEADMLAAALPPRRRADGGSGAERVAPPGPAVVRTESLGVARADGRGLAVRDATLAVAGGELVGVAAVQGNGERELLRAIAGLLQPAAGRLEVVPPLAFVPEDRTTEGLIPELSLTENVVLGFGRDAPWVRRGRIDWRVARACTEHLVARFGIQAPAPEVPAAALSGGNQQRLVIARALERAPRVFVAENPTRGLDIQAAHAVWTRLREAAAAGAGVLVYASDLDEVLAWADRVLVVTNGVVVPAPASAGRAEIGELMLRRPERPAVPAGFGR